MSSDALLYRGDVLPGYGPADHAVAKFDSGAAFQRFYL